MIDVAAYWISPYGRIFPVPYSHIEFIIGNPRRFDLSRQYIGSVYFKYGEPMRSEGDARNEIIADVIQQGWIRIRFVPKQFSYTAQLSRWGKREQGMGSSKSKKTECIGVTVIDLNENVLCENNIKRFAGLSRPFSLFISNKRPPATPDGAFPNFTVRL
jgi:hypothetical protein